MLHHYFTAAFRNIRKNKLSFFINLVGLSLGLASAFIISSYVLKETSYDQFHSKKNHIFRILCDNNNFDCTSPGVPYVMKGHIDNSIPVVEKSCLMNRLYMAKIKLNDEYHPFKEMQACTPEFFDIFDCKLISGNLDKALIELNSIVLTEKFAEKYFPNQNPIGKSLEIKIDSEIYQLIVDAVIEDFPMNSSIRFNALCNFNLSLKTFENKPWAKTYKTDWKYTYNRMYVLLKNKNSSSFQSAWNQLEKNLDLETQHFHFYSQSLRDIHLNSQNFVNDGTRGNKSFVYLFSSIAFIILLVAAFNYIILSISISKIRYKEIGIKKILGSHSSTIKKQFLSESIIIGIIAFPLAYLMAIGSLNFLNKLFNISIEINILENPMQLITFLLLLFAICFISGSYIAFYLSRLNPLEIIKSKTGNQNKKIRFQYLMLIFQIMVFTGLTGASLSIYRQVDFIKNADLGINLNNKMVLNYDNLNLNSASRQTLNNILSNIPEIENFTFGIFLPPENSRSVRAIKDPSDETKQIHFEGERVSWNFFDFFDIKCVQGRLFNENSSGDSSKLIINESAANFFGLDNPVGKTITKSEIIGVVKDYHTHSLHENVAPIVYSLLKPSIIYEIGIEYKEGLEEICSEKVIHEISKFNPEATVVKESIEDKIENLYSEEINLNNIMMYFSLFAIVIALIGIFGQSLFAAKQQVKEIGIRKVNGATSQNILLMVLRRYTILCLIANLISWPIVYYLIDKWQNAFVYKSPISIGLILFTFALSTFVILTTVLINAWKATLTNPVNVLKYE
ncbi:MAG: ABC transporter permease [Bacteroidales bacterium]|nr:ABC transporter permease [Bacteroidales bacterium]